MARCHTTILLAFALLTMTAIPAAGGDEPMELAPSVVEIDVETGELLSPPAQPRTNVTVRVHGVAASEGGFDLQGPLGPLFLNQSSRHDGIVEFWDVPAVPGSYEVNRSMLGSNHTLATFDLTGAVDADCEDPTVPCTTTDWCWGSSRSEKLGESIRWSPLLIVNSPSDGRATAHASWTDTKAVFVSPGAWTSEARHSNIIEAEDGHSKGFYRLAKWGIYERTDYCWGSSTTNQEAKAIDWRPSGYPEEAVLDLTGESTYTDRDNPAQLAFKGNWTLRHYSGYYSPDRIHHNGGSETITDKEISGIQGSISAGPHYVTFDVISFEITKGEEISYQYEYGDKGTWYIDEVNDGNGLAFCRKEHAGCE